jgi:hypothetical protein
MRDLLRRWFVREERAIVGDLASGDWTPPPPGETGSTDWARWINEEAPRPRARASATARAPEEPLHLTLPSALADRSDDIVGTWAEPLELELVEEEVIEGQPVPEPPASEPVAAPAPRRRRATLGGGRARIRTPLPERRWRDVLSGYAEHLTDEELAIIRAQMGK